ncbi:MAG: hypothetical protein MSQ05_02160 [Akkermansia sp.]|nr:hypothetical protein [Akkermansia sp.]
MRLHLPKALLAAVLAACLAWPAGAFTSTTTNYPTGSDTPTTFNGDIWTWNNNGDKVSSSNATYTKYSDTNVTYRGNADNTGGPTYFYNYFFNGRETNYLGNTLRFNGADANKTLTTDFETYVWIGGIITESGDYTYTLGRDAKSIFKLNGSNAVNMIINSSFTFKANSESSVAVEKGGTWTIAKGKSLTFSAGPVSIAAGQTVNVASSGSGDSPATLAFSGDVTNNGTLNPLAELI